MEKITYLLWRAVSNPSSLVSGIFKEASKLIESEINEGGGIAGKRISIDYMAVPKGKAGIDRVLETLRNSPNIL